MFSPIPHLFAELYRAGSVACVECSVWCVLVTPMKTFALHRDISQTAH